MKKIAVLAFICSLALMGSGCATRGYFADRLGDAGDIFTATVGIGAGAKVRVGPIQPALIFNHDIAGLQIGRLFAGPLFPEYGFERGEYEVFCPFPLRFIVGSVGWLPPHPFADPETRWRLGRGYRPPNYHGYWIVGKNRAYTPWAYREMYRTEPRVGSASLFPCIVFSCPIQHNAQIEVAGGLGLTARVGFNPVELLDFVLGWFRIDLCNDDRNYKLHKTRRMIEGEWELVEPERLSSDKFPLLAKGNSWIFTVGGSFATGVCGTAQYYMRQPKFTGQIGSMVLKLGEYDRLKLHDGKKEATFDWSVKDNILILNPYNVKPVYVKKDVEIKFRRKSR